MSIIPLRPTHREVVLRHNDAVIIYDPSTHQLVRTQGSLELSECPTCHQPLRRGRRPTSQEHGSHGSGQAAGFVHPAYFALHQSLYGSRENSAAPSSPRRRLVEPIGIQESSPRTPPRPVYSDTPPRSDSPAPGISVSAFSQGYFQTFYTVEKELGSGGKGVVFLVTHILDGNPIGNFACKRVPVGDDREWLKKVLTEVQLLQWLRHKHLVQYHHVWLEDVQLSRFGPSIPCAYILQQFCNAGDLHGYVIQPPQEPSSSSHQQLKERARRRSKGQPEPLKALRGRKLSFDEIYSLFKGIVSGLNHLHVNGYIHRDLKPSNCLLHDEGEGLNVLVSDFGEAQVENMVRKSTGATGTISYCAPEVLRRQATGELGNFTRKSDIFSLGMILYFLCFAQLPYHNADILNEENEDLDHLRDEITSWGGLHEERKLRPDLPEQLYTFLRRLLSLDPKDRPSAEDILLSIKTNSGLDEISDSRPRTGKHMFEDLRNDARISPVDSPRPSTPTRKTSTSFVRAGSLANLRLSSTQRERSTAFTPTSEGNSSEDVAATSPGGSLVLRERERFPSLTKLPAPLPDIQQIAAPPSWVPRRIFLAPLQSPTTKRVIKVCLLLLKVLSINRLCAPMAASNLVMASLLAFGTLDILLSGSGISIILVLVHILVLLGTAKMGVLCMPGRAYWKDV
ncbi:hypothetical protein MMC21_004542 [Puttea exsequens]|nr:hypothetical protein [Puttea exsequens]